MLHKIHSWWRNDTGAIPALLALYKCWKSTGYHRFPNTEGLQSGALISTCVRCCTDNLIFSDKTRLEAMWRHCNVSNKCNSSIVYILLHELIVECIWPDRGGWEFIGSHGAGTFVCPIKYRSRNRHRNMWDGWCISSRLLPRVWFEYLHELCIYI